MFSLCFYSPAVAHTEFVKNASLRPSLARQPAMFFLISQLAVRLFENVLMLEAYQ